MRCKQCKELMVLITTLQGNYNLCKTCSNVDFSYNDDELDNIADRGRD